MGLLLPSLAGFMARGGTALCFAGFFAALFLGFWIFASFFFGKGFFFAACFFAGEDFLADDFDAALDFLCDDGLLVACFLTILTPFLEDVSHIPVRCGNKYLIKAGNFVPCLLIKQ